MEEEMEEIEEKIYLENNSGLSYGSADRKLTDPLLYTAETIECSVMLVCFLAVTILIFIFPGISTALLRAYCRIKECGINQIINDLISQIKQLL